MVCIYLVFSSTNKTDHHDMTEILLKVVLNTINQTKLIINCSKCYNHDHDPPLFWTVLEAANMKTRDGIRHKMGRESRTKNSNNNKSTVPLIYDCFLIKKKTI
jgi:hypothetical protein